MASLAASVTLEEAGGRLGEVPRVALRDGVVVEVRAMERADRAALAAAAARLSARSLYLRFASPKPRLTARDLDWLAAIEHHSHEALVAIDVVTRRGIGVARYVALTDEPGVVEAAVTVDDAWQGRGLGSVLLAAVVNRASEEGYRAVRASVLAENTPARAMVRRAGFLARARAGAVLELELPLRHSRELVNVS